MVVISFYIRGVASVALSPYSNSSRRVILVVTSPYSSFRWEAMVVHKMSFCRIVGDFQVVNGPNNFN